MGDRLASLGILRFLCGYNFPHHRRAACFAILDQSLRKEGRKIRRKRVQSSRTFHRRKARVLNVSQTPVTKSIVSCTSCLRLRSGGKRVRNRVRKARVFPQADHSVSSDGATHTIQHTVFITTVDNTHVSHIPQLHVYSSGTWTKTMQ